MSRSEPSALERPLHDNEPSFEQRRRIPIRPVVPDTPAQATVRALVATHRDRPGALLPLLHAVQDTLGCVPPDVVPVIAEGLRLSRAEVHGVITYYHHFREVRPGRHVVQICQAEACRARGAEALTADAERLLGCRMHETRDDGAVTLEPVYCLGLCASSPALTVDEKPMARMTSERLARLAVSLGVAA
jgi:formate dehydrogenase subunit gamma